MIEKNVDEKFVVMTTGKISHIIPSLALPTVVSMLVSSIYNMADTFFVSRISTSASAAVGIVFSIMAIIQSLGFALGMGCGSNISRKLGEKNVVSANEFASSAFFAALLLGVLLSVFSLTNLDALMVALGSSETVLPFAKSYGQYILLGAPIMMASFVMNNVLRWEGHASFSMIALTSGGVLNVVLDPIFIFGFKLGTAGAAIATLISQCVGFVIFAQFFLRKKGIVSISIFSISKKIRTYILIVTTGLPSLFRQGLASVSTIFLNTHATVYGDAAVAGVSIVTRITMLVASIMVGIGQGFSPVAGYNYGAQKFNRVKEAYSFTVKLGTAILTSCGALLFFFAPTIIRFFRPDDAVIEIGSLTLRFQSAVLCLHGFVIGTNMLMQSTGKNLQATFLACNRQGIYFIPLIFILPHFFGIAGIAATQALSDILSAITAIPYVIWFFRTARTR